MNDRCLAFEVDELLNISLAPVAAVVYDDRPGPNSAPRDP